MLKAVESKDFTAFLFYKLPGTPDKSVPFRALIWILNPRPGDSSDLISRPNLNNKPRLYPGPFLKVWKPPPNNSRLSFSPKSVHSLLVHGLFGRSCWLSCPISPFDPPSRFAGQFHCPIWLRRRRHQKASPTNLLIPGKSPLSLGSQQPG